ncbi:MAG TPA: nuclear transport factor 2 family protein [Acidisarcina sp.]|nr:nuclear transport factor 2 family protein [Acidisarcina sp.]
MNVQSFPIELTPKEVLLRFYEAEANYMRAFAENGTASFEEMKKTMAPDVVLHQSPDLPFGGEYIGHGGYEQWAMAMRSIFDRLEVTEREFFEQGEKIIVICRFITRSRINGSVQDFPMAQAVTVRDGKIIDFRPFYWNVPAYVAATER